MGVQTPESLRSREETQSWVDGLGTMLVEPRGGKEEESWTLALNSCRNECPGAAGSTGPHEVSGTDQDSLVTARQDFHSRAKGSFTCCSRGMGRSGMGHTGEVLRGLLRLRAEYNAVRRPLCWLRCEPLQRDFQEARGRTRHNAQGFLQPLQPTSSSRPSSLRNSGAKTPHSHAPTPWVLWVSNEQYGRSQTLKSSTPRRMFPMTTSAPSHRGFPGAGFGLAVKTAG